MGLGTLGGWVPLLVAICVGMVLSIFIAVYATGG